MWLLPKPRLPLRRMPRCALHMAPRTWREAECQPGDVPAGRGAFRCQGSRVQVGCMGKVVLPLLPSASPDLAPGRPGDPPGAGISSFCPGIAAHPPQSHWPPWLLSVRSACLQDTEAGTPEDMPGDIPVHTPPRALFLLPPPHPQEAPSPLNPASGPVSMLSSLLREMSSPQRALLGEGL